MSKHRVNGKILNTDTSWFVAELYNSNWPNEAHRWEELWQSKKTKTFFTLFHKKGNEGRGYYNNCTCSVLTEVEAAQALLESSMLDQDDIDNILRREYFTSEEVLNLLQGEEI